ncbi:MAG: hypothetical protein IJ038_03570, partial [Clostridia bacterium]|nr:hypothetical protein [Clostridia bacterium]
IVLFDFYFFNHKSILWGDIFFDLKYSLWGEAKETRQPSECRYAPRAFLLIKRYSAARLKNAPRLRGSKGTPLARFFGSFLAV